MEEVATLPNGAHLFVLEHVVLANHAVFGGVGLETGHDRVGTNVGIGGGYHDGLHQIVIEEGGYNVGEAGRVKGSVEHSQVSGCNSGGEEK